MSCLVNTALAMDGQGEDDLKARVGGPGGLLSSLLLNQSRQSSTIRVFWIVLNVEI